MSTLGAAGLLAVAGLAAPALARQVVHGPNTAATPGAISRSTSNIAPAKLSIPAQDGAPASPRGANAADNCNDAPTVGEGTFGYDLAGATNDFFGSCGDSSAAEDVWYRYVPTFTGIALASTCGQTTGDSVLLVTDQCNGSELACVDDACGLQSEILFSVVAGDDYYVRVANYGGGVHAGSVTFSEQPACVLTPPSGGVDEGEACGADINGGCNSAVPVFSTITCGGSVNGTAFADGVTRDTDWYDLALTGTNDVTISAQAQFPVLIFILDANCPPAILATATAARCEIATATATVTGAARIFVANQTFAGNLCGNDNDYWVSVDSCTPVAPCKGITVPPGATADDEKCGLETNDGCNVDPVAFSQITTDGVIAGSSYAQANTRDTDWYQFTYPASGLATFTVTSDFSAIFFVLSFDPADPCPSLALAAQADTRPCETDTVTANGVPGDIGYFFVSTGTVAGGIFDGIPCHASYYFVADIGVPEGDTCPCDFNANGSLNSQDFFDFLAAFFTSAPTADYNDDTVVNSQDFFDFLSCFFAPPATCP
ncbi:MAG: hypothetical protein H7210_09530 [Pyrinomonadaceae bacterium]|nr:hypothetical protein [Phycisphaerales bacterium]